jgi:uncharacterized protein (DUF924 family)
VTKPELIGEILDYWFRQLSPEHWFKADAVRDEEIKTRFGEVYAALKSGVPANWIAEPDGCLAVIIVLDQFPRNMFRGQVHAFATDAAALALAKRAIAEGKDMLLPPAWRAFLYMPFQHSELAADQARSVELFTALGNKLNLDFAIRHKEVIGRFGRFPHRNEILGRKSTAEEIAFLEEPGSSF